MVLHDLGTNAFLLRKYEIKNAIKDRLRSNTLRTFLITEIPEAIKAVQSIRNASAHDEAASLKKCTNLRKRMLGIGTKGILHDLAVHQKHI